MKIKLVVNTIFILLCEPCLKGLNADESSNNLMVVTTENTAIATTESFRSPRSYIYRRGSYEHDEHHEDDTDEMEETDEMEDNKSLQGKNDYWGGYYDFLINEGSYKFWAVFQLATAALLIYSGFAALYYAKVNPTTTDDYEDYYLRRRKRNTNLNNMNMDRFTFLRIIDALENFNKQ